jgi:hypothetical protein
MNCADGAVLVSTENSAILLNKPTYEGGFFMFLWTKKERKKEIFCTL